VTINISIITATYNCAATVGECLASVASQDYSDTDHVVIDGASSDTTLQVLEKQRARIATLLSEPDRGIYDALNKGIAKAKGDVIGLLHADDLYGSNEVLSQVAAEFEDPKVQAVYGNLQYVSRADPARVIRHWHAGEFSKAKLARGWMPPHPTLFLRREVYEQFGGFDIGYRIAADYDFMLRVLSKLDRKIVYIPQVLVKMRVGGASNRSITAIVRKSSEDYRVLRSNHFGVLGALTALALKNLSKVPQFF